jgi:hypothetical protein
VSVAAVRAAALAGALVLAVLSRGDVVVLATLLVVAARGPLRAVAVVAALKATAWRWSSASLEHIAAAQSVLGPAGFVDPPSAAASGWLAAAAIILATPTLPLPSGSTRRDRGVRLAIGWLPRATFAAAAAAVVAGPAARDGAWVRGLAFVVALLVSTLLRRTSPLARSVGAVVCGAGSLVAAALDTPPLTGIIDGAAFVEGVALAAAVGGLAWVGATALRHAPPRLRR